MNNLKRYRALRGLTQSELAHRVGVSRTSIHNAENGKLSLVLATKCEEVLQVNRYALLGLDAIVGEPNQIEMGLIEMEIVKELAKREE